MVVLEFIIWKENYGIHAHALFSMGYQELMTEFSMGTSDKKKNFDGMRNEFQANGNAQPSSPTVEASRVDLCNICEERLMPRKKLTPKEYADVATGVRLSSHEKLCAERMKQIQESIKELK